MTGETLLLVDDEDNLRSMLEAALRHSGFEVHPVANGRDALDAVPEVKPDLIVLDVMLPDLDGFAVCQRLRSTGDRTPVLFLTARDTTEDLSLIHIYDPLLEEPVVDVCAGVHAPGALGGRHEKRVIHAAQASGHP